MTAASRIIGRIPIGGAENNNGAGELRFLECSNLKCARGLSLFSDSIILKIQNSRPWEKLAKVWSSIFEASHSYAALSIVASTRLLLSEIFGISYVNWSGSPWRSRPSWRTGSWTRRRRRWGSSRTPCGDAEGGGRMSAEEDAAVLRAVADYGAVTPRDLWRMPPLLLSEEEARDILDRLAGEGLLRRIDGDVPVYALTPPPGDEK